MAAGVMVHLTDDDQITSTHRGHGHLVAKGGDFRAMYAELFGKVTGYCHGKGGSMHISDLELGMLGANGIVGGSIPIAVGAAFANRYRRNSLVTVCFFGDGASNEGAFHEAANMAALYRLPVVFVCENNGYGEFTAQARHQAITDIADRAAGYGMPGVIVDGMDAIAVFDAAGECIGRARDGEGPSLLECKTYRYYDHVGVTACASRTGTRPRSTSGRRGTRSQRSSCVWRRGRARSRRQAARAPTRPRRDRRRDRVRRGERLPDVASLTDDVYSNPIVIGVAR